ncbi:thiamine pyrophosphate-binding protein [Polaromonas sp. CG_23.6]|uniref:thiamine pyrophosphate-binding protein n=1 Tax=Polaromonas sp. CG_23.6 TaxID=2760709 RepID=UPI002475A376|nr:thiamine pyrophosphate-binding protein [Polaromonas sp. CG_23.6]MDH6182766.1 acetolactate synthase-1/2/3 large subunit [Polaromonas sp. CG_23.6]
MNTASRNRGCDALIQSLKTAGVRRIFTLSGNHIMPIYDAAFNSGIELIHTRHEASAVHMADAYARITGEVGVALVTGGPGHGNAVSALYTAQMAESPVVLLSGHAPNNQHGLGAFQEMRQAEMAVPVTKAAWTCAGPDQLAGDIARAIRIARSGRPGPVNLNLPTDALDDLAEAPALVADAFEPETMALDWATASDLMQRLSQAKRPMILAGPACMTRPGRAMLAALEAASGVPVIGMESPRGIADASLGAFAQMLAQADCVLLVGKRVDFTLKFGKAPALSAQTIVHQVDAEPAEIERTRNALGARLHVTALADAFSSLSALTQAASSGAPYAWLADVRGAVAYRPPEWDSVTSELTGKLHPVQMLRPLQALLDSHPESVLVCDGGEIGQWAMACLNAPHRVNNGVAGSIGSGLAYALAARCAQPQAPVVAVMGDGTVGFHIAEYDTAMRYGLPFVSVVGNDARWNAEYQIQLRDYGADRLVGCELRPMRYDAVVQAFGGHGELVTEPQAMASAVQRAQASGLPACLNVMIEGVPAPQIKY